jgi:hypothetical protein
MEAPSLADKINRNKLMSSTDQPQIVGEVRAGSRNQGFESFWTESNHKGSQDQQQQQFTSFGEIRNQRFSKASMGGREKS